MESIIQIYSIIDQPHYIIELWRKAVLSIY